MTGGHETNRSERERLINRARRRKILKRSLVSSGITVLVIGIVFVLVRYQKRSGPITGENIPDQGRAHVSLGTRFDYNSNPPTSGPHHAIPAEWGVYQQAIHDQILIHNLEHGGIWISYRLSVASSTVEQLEVIAKEFGRKVIMAPRPANDADIALAAWNHLDKFSEAEFSEQRVRKFIIAFRNKGPEFVP